MYMGKCSKCGSIKTKSGERFVDGERISHSVSWSNHNGYTEQKECAGAFVSMGGREYHEIREAILRIREATAPKGTP